MVSLVDSTSVYDFSIGFWNYSDSVIFFVLIFLFIYFDPFNVRAPMTAHKK